MLLTIPRPRLALRAPTAAVDPTIEAIVNLLPDYSSGNRLHALAVNRVMGALPGNYSQLIGSGPSFRSIFYPNYQPDALTSFLQDTGLDDNWWRGFSVAVLCKSIADLGSNIRGQMIAGKIDGDLATFNSTFRSRCARVYARVFAATFPPLAALLQKVDRATAKRQFHDSLLSNVQSRQLWYQAGMWTSPDWELFNQYAKYIALGASDGEVDTLIDELHSAGLPIPAQVARSAWRSYSEELRNKPAVDAADVRDSTSGPIQATTYLPNFGGGAPARMPNGNCYEFTANSQPGRDYRQLPSSCCFTGDTEVLDGSGNPRPLHQIKPKDTVLTRDGVATVAFVPRPRLGGRTLYRLNDGGPTFTDTHPFLNGASPEPLGAAPALLALSPQRLAWAVPTLSEDGIGELRSGSTLLGRASGAGQGARPVAVTAVAAVTPPSGDDHLYDLNLVAAGDARQEFWVGRGGQFYLAAPEFPVLGQAGAAAVAVVAIMEGLLAAGGASLAGWPKGMVETIHDFGAGVFNFALLQALHTAPSFGAPAPGTPLSERINRLYAGLDEVPTAAAAAVATLFDGLLSAIGPWLSASVALGWRQCQTLGGDVLAVTVFDMALTPETPIPADTSIRLGLTVRGGSESAATSMWDRRGRTNTRFHHYFDQLLHVDPARPRAPEVLVFNAAIDGAPIPSLFGEAPLVPGDAEHRFASALLQDAAGTVIGSVRFDARLLSQEAASNELAQSGLWTDAAAAAYANALGAAMVAPIMKGLRDLAPTK